MRTFPHRQHPADWLTQYWNIVLGRRAQPEDAWLLGPVGRPGGVGEAIADQIAAHEGLTVVRDARGGLVQDRRVFAGLEGAVDPAIIAFYLHTSDYTMDVWTRWEPMWSPWARLVDRVFARRVNQLRLPADPLATSQGITSEIIRLVDRAGEVQATLWLRKLVATGNVIYAGFYREVWSPAGEPLVKIVFPLPHGSATVLMRLESLPNGGLRLSSRGERLGDAGFYFVVQDSRGGTWLHYLRGFHEFIELQCDRAGEIRAEHTMALWGRRCYSLHYRVRAAQAPTPPAS